MSFRAAKHVSVFVRCNSVYLLYFVATQFTCFTSRIEARVSVCTLQKQVN
jgi:hypothetical protein